MAKTKTKGTVKTVGDTPVPQPITISSTNPKIMADNIKKLEKAIKGADDASEISYDNTASHLTASNVQAAIDEVVSSMTPPAAEDVSYDNTDSGLTADDVQEAIDEVNGKLNNRGLCYVDKSITFDGDGSYRYDNDSDLIDLMTNVDKIIKAEVLLENEVYMIIMPTYYTNKYFTLKNPSTFASVSNVTVTVRIYWIDNIINKN